MMSNVHDGGQNTLFSPLFLPLLPLFTITITILPLLIKISFRCRCDKVMRFGVAFNKIEVVESKNAKIDFRDLDG